MVEVGFIIALIIIYPVLRMVSWFSRTFRHYGVTSRSKRKRRSRNNWLF